MSSNAMLCPLCKSRDISVQVIADTHSKSRSAFIMVALFSIDRLGDRSADVAIRHAAHAAHPHLPPPSGGNDHTEGGCLPALWASMEIETQLKSIKPAQPQYNYPGI